MTPPVSHSSRYGDEPGHSVVRPFLVDLRGSGSMSYRKQFPGSGNGPSGV